MRPAVTRHAPQAAILLVDDNVDGIAARRSLLEELGYRVVPAASGFDALQLAAVQAFDLIITDFRMSPVDGLQLISQLRERSFEKPIILLTGFADNLGLRPESTGADAVIQKNANEVATLVRHTKRLLNTPRKPAHSQTKTAAANRREAK